jgi:hypothetical protein
MFKVVSSGSAPSSSTTVLDARIGYLGTLPCRLALTNNIFAGLDLQVMPPIGGFLAL